MFRVECVFESDRTLGHPTTSIRVTLLEVMQETMAEEYHEG